MMLDRAGIDIKLYGPHFTRGATASKAQLLGASVKSTVKHACWKTARSFALHYSKRVEKRDKVARRLLDDSNAQLGRTLIVARDIDAVVLKRP